MDYIFPARIEPDPDAGYTVTFPDVPEAITGGTDLDEARRNGTKALGLALRGYLVMGWPLPKARTAGEGLTEIAVDAADALKLAVGEAFAEAGISKTELARRLGKAENEARRILDPDHPTKLDTLKAALHVLGKKVVVTVLDAA